MNFRDNYYRSVITATLQSKYGLNFTKSYGTKSFQNNAPLKVY